MFWCYKCLICLFIWIHDDLKKKAMEHQWLKIIGFHSNFNNDDIADADYKHANRGSQ